MVNLELTLNDIELVYPGIYKARDACFGDQVRFQTGFTYEGLELENVGIERRPKDGMYNSNSRFAPVVHTCDYKRLVEALAIVDARNLGRDRLLKGMLAEVRLSIYTYDNEQGKGKGFSIINIMLDAEAMYKKATED